MTKISRRSQGQLSDQIYELLKQRIVSGEMAPESQVSELPLQEEFGVSNTPVRRALKLLETDGLVVIYPQFGTFVAPLSLEAAEQAQFIREHLECALVPDIVARLDSRGEDELLSCLHRQKQALADGNPSQFYDLDEQLHAHFASLAGREGVGQIIRQQKVHLDRIRRLSLPIHDQIPRLIGQHEAVVAALVARNAIEAETALRLHLREFFSTLESLGLPSQATRTMARRQSTRRAAE